MRPVTVEKNPAFSPGYCYRCRCGAGAQNRKYFIDLGLDIDYIGRFYLCNVCFVDIVEDAKTPDVVTMRYVNSVLDEANDQVAKAKRESEEFNLVRDHMSNIGLDMDNLLSSAKKHLDLQGGTEQTEVQTMPVVESPDLTTEQLAGGVLHPEIVHALKFIQPADDGTITGEVEPLRLDDGTADGTVDPTSVESDGTEPAPDGGPEFPVIPDPNVNGSSGDPSVTAEQPEPPAGIDLDLDGDGILDSESGKKLSE